MTTTVKIPFGARRKDPFVFRTFFEMGLEESASPFLSKRAQKLAQHLPLKASIFALFLLIVSFFTHGPFSQIALLMVYLIAGIPILIDSLEDLFFRKDINIDLLMTVAAFAAYGLGAEFEGALLLVLFAISGSLESLVTLKAKNSISLIHSLAPQTALVVDETGHTKEKAVLDVKVGEHLLVRAGEIIPLDGEIISGRSSLSLAHLTGEALPVARKEGQEVPAGARVIEGSLTIKAIRDANESAVSQIINLITKAQSGRPRLEKWFDRFGRFYAISIITVSIVAGIFFYKILGLDLLGRDGAIYRSLAFLIAASPCALVLAVPIAYLSSLGACANRGVVLKGGVVLDALDSCKIVAFDKTGTLTLGSLSCESITPSIRNVYQFSENEVVALAATLERGAVHPIAKAILEKAEKLSFYPVSSLKVVPGSHVEGEIDFQGKKIFATVGAPVLSELPEDLVKEAAVKQKEGQILCVFRLGSSSWLFAFQDSPRPKVAAMIENLEKSGKNLLMLTGDHADSAARIAKSLGIAEFWAELTPEDKLEKISELSKKKGLAMCGDGINDAPALARATVGISMGRGASGTAQEVADCILLHDNIEILDWLFQKAHLTKKIVIQNVIIALAAMTIASLPALGGIVPLWLAVVLHEGGTVLVGLNAIRLLR